MAFKIPTTGTSVPDSPDKLFRELPRRKFPDVLPHQAQMMQAYAAKAVNAEDVALQLPTGSGKTLVGLLIAEWRRRKYRERVIYLCPTKQLVYQVAEEAEKKYGLSVSTFVGSKRDFTPASKTDYLQAQKIAVTTYSALFNTNPFFNQADIIFVDDAHASENYIAHLWTLRVNRLEGRYAGLHQALCNAFAPYLTATDLSRLSGVWEDVVDRNWVEKIATPTVVKLTPQIIEILDAHTQDTDLAYSWSLIRSHLDACHVYLSSQEIMIRPLLPPTFSHPAFGHAKQRIYMSATLGAGGDLERLTGRKKIMRLPAPDGWDTQGVGRRFFIFPEMSLTAEETVQLRCELMRRASRSVVLVPSDKAAAQVAEEVNKNLKFRVFHATDIEESKADFTLAKEAVAVVANRYDGIDFAGDECRLLFIEGLPKAMNAQERFLMTRMAANALYNERIQTRVVQAIGRCTRSLEDYSAVVVSGDELPDYLADLRRRPFFHPELQAEISFGAEQSRGTELADIIENFEIFLANGRDWEQVNRLILDERDRTQQTFLPAIAELESAVGAEIDYQTALWNHNYDEAVGAAERVLGILTSADLRGYRALWNYLAGSACYLGAQAGNSSMAAKSRQYFSDAHKCAPTIPWLTTFARREVSESVNVQEDDIALQRQVERLGAELTRLGATHDRDFAKLEMSILDGLRHPDTFEQAQKDLGGLLGFNAGKVESDGSPDPWWICDTRCIVFEDYVNTSDGTLHVNKARQATSHPDWMRANVSESSQCEFLTVLVTPATKISQAALVHAAGLLYWELGNFCNFAAHALQVVRKLRSSFFEQGDLVWQAQAMEVLKQQAVDFASICRHVQASPVEHRMQAV
ncbi:DEAD/DEAH box helicase [Pseudomonas carnis]|mgnify:CR=1 FL=1|uniref:DEAD/DEAH box helicase n=1 Tax=Pseudomonas carnis TaxID=2487355 RepID=UPI0015E2EECF|nr:DEAD/DEAH box helicase [Pseudomonas carnis]MBA1302652.1 DEAD/DEAH box helicase [Pseudomonas carnis]MBJ2204759.1 DEAD/DEAH box helicase [Pseudomonas carnis]